MMKWLFTCLLALTRVLPVWANYTVIHRAYESKSGDVQVNYSGRVVHILADDNQGSRLKAQGIKNSF
ncbi:DUF3465 domain-containing protein [Shewanella sp. 10N.286.48.B5]|uniref:DUF3465 domain-containing protein n=1 Tax=Shewanella sp. 10N.286.48.B5 TaxID=1880834 RepID=UPI0039A554E5